MVGSSGSLMFLQSVHRFIDVQKSLAPVIVTSASAYTGQTKVALLEVRLSTTLSLGIHVDTDFRVQGHCSHEAAAFYSFPCFKGPRRHCPGACTSMHRWLEVFLSSQSIFNPACRSSAIEQLATNCTFSSFTQIQG